MGEYIQVQSFVPVKKNDPTELYLEEHKFNLHASRIMEFANPMTEVMDYNRPNPRRRRIFWLTQLGEKGVKPYGTLRKQVPPR